MAAPPTPQKVAPPIRAGSPGPRSKAVRRALEAAEALRALRTKINAMAPPARASRRGILPW